MVAIDATVLTLFLRPDSGAPLAADGKAVEHAAERIEHLITTLSDEGETLIIPTPALSEALVRSDADTALRIITDLQKHAAFRIEPFDSLAAIELATMTRESLGRRRKRENSTATWAKLKFDQQIVAIAKVHQASTIYSDDADIRAIAKRAGITVVGVAELDLPPASAQFPLEL